MRDGGPDQKNRRPPDQPPAKAASLDNRVGPFETEREAAAAARHIYDLPPATGAWGAAMRKMLEDACASAGVDLGAHDRAILAWLAGWEPSTAATIAGWITRAGAR